MNLSVHSGPAERTPGVTAGYSFYRHHSFFGAGYQTYFADSTTLPSAKVLSSSFSVDRNPTKLQWRGEFAFFLYCRGFWQFKPPVGRGFAPPPSISYRQSEFFASINRTSPLRPIDQLPEKGRGFHSTIKSFVDKPRGSERLKPLPQGKSFYHNQTRGGER